MATADGAVIVLGAGWLGSSLAQRLHDDGVDVHVTHRPGSQPALKPPYFRPIPLSDEIPCHSFHLAKPETWPELPPPESMRAAVLTFPLNLEHLEPFHAAWLSRVPVVLAYSSTSVYQVSYPEEWVSEETPLKASGRVVAESWLQERGGTLLTLSGLYGAPSGPRSVCACLGSYAQSGGTLNGVKHINMVHTKDVVEITMRCLASPRPNRRFNVGGRGFRLRDLISHCKYPVEPQNAAVDVSSKYVSSQRALEEMLPESFEFDLPIAACTPAAPDGETGEYRSPLPPANVSLSLANATRAAAGVTAGGATANAVTAGGVTADGGGASMAYRAEGLDVRRPPAPSAATPWSGERAAHEVQETVERSEKVERSERV